MTTAIPWAAAFDEAGWAVPPILDPRNGAQALGYLEKYFEVDSHKGPLFTGSYFEYFGGGGDSEESKDEITRDDLLALALLGVPVGGNQIIQFLSPSEGGKKVDLEKDRTRDFTAYQLPYDLHQITEILKSIPTDADFRSEKITDYIASGNKLWVALRRKHFGPARTSKLMARKRPNLFPIIDSVVKNQLATSSRKFYEYLHLVLCAEDRALMGYLEDLHAEAVGKSDHPYIAQISTIRIFDIIIWMSGRKL